MIFDNLQVLKQEKVSVESLFIDQLKLTVLSDEKSRKNYIGDKNLSRPQLALTGYTDLFNPQRLQVFGNTELKYLNSLSGEDRLKAFRFISDMRVPCILLTNSITLEDDLLREANEKNILVISTAMETTQAMYILSEMFDDLFAPHVVIHGSFVDVYGVGILFVGRSGIGKSEIALDLIERGHRLVADDVVMLTKKRETTLMGTGTSLVKHFMEIRGLGIIDIRQMFGIRAIRFQKRVEIIVELLDWNSEEEYSRIGLDEEPKPIMGINISTVKLPIFPGKNITVIAEVIAINYLLRTYGYNAAKIFSDALADQIKKNKGPESVFQDMRHINWFQADTE